MVDSAFNYWKERERNALEERERPAEPKPGACARAQQQPSLPPRPPRKPSSSRTEREVQSSRRLSLEGDERLSVVVAHLNLALVGRPPARPRPGPDR